MDKIHFGIVKSGKFVPDNPELFKKAFWLFEGKSVEVIVRKKRKRRSNNQNAYYWGVVLPLIADRTGYTIDESHDAMRILFLAKRGSKVATVKSTRSLNTAEMEDYLSKIKTFASAVLSCYIPDPNEVDYDVS